MLTDLGADEILRIKPFDAGRLFGRDPKEVRKSFRKLASIWHPDVCSHPKGNEVFKHLMMLREAAERLAGRHQALRDQDPERVFETTDGKRIGLRPLSVTPSDTGEIIVCANSVTFLHNADFADFADREEEMVSDFCFPSDRVRQDIERFLPKIAKRMDLKDGRSATAVARTGDDILLSDLLAKRTLEPVHAAWLCSSLMNLASWLYWSDLCHGAIEPKHILISPAGHSVKLVGGWGVTTPLGERPEALPERTITTLPRLALPGEVTTPQDDLHLIRRTVCEALGDPSGNRLHESGMPQPLINWLTFPPAANGIEDYQAWEKALDASWDRRFVPLEVTPADIYGA